MSYHLRIVTASDFLKMDHYGKTDLPKSKQALADLAKNCIEEGIRCALVDLREVQTPSLSLTEVYQLALAFRDMGFRHDHRLAVLHRYQAGERAEFFATTAQDQGWNVRAFDNYEDAMEWFGSSFLLK